MTPEEFIKLGKDGYNHVPVVRTMFADLDTPLSCYIKVARGPYSYLLESAAQGGEKWARYSLVGLPSDCVVKIRGYEITIEESGEVTDRFQVEDPLAFVEEFQAGFSYPELQGLPIYT
ncbi:MAG: anthranilate synthase component I, partial [Gammaproteobacteria bacterium]|nr:anthranilate synthase component I [Gammaproteobacteria bacterium]